MYIYFKIKAPEPEVGTGLSILPGKGAGGAGQSQDAGQGSEADFSPGSAQRAGREAGFTTSCAAVHPPPGALHISARLGAPGASNCLAAPPPSLEANSHSLWGFTLSPGPCRLPTPGQLQLAREEEGELGAGVTLDSCGEGRQGQRARGRASAGFQLQPLPLQSSPRRHSKRRSRAGAPSRVLLAAARGMAAPWGREVGSPSGHLPSGKRWGMDSLPGSKS